MAPIPSHACLRLSLALLAALLGSCRSSRPPDSAHRPDAAASEPDAELEQLARAHIEATFLESPTTATWMGQHAYDGLVDPLDRASLVRRAARLEALGARLDALPEARLDPLHRIDRVLLEREVRRGRFLLQEERVFERDPSRYLAVLAGGIDELLSHDHQPLGERLLLVARRLGGVRALLDAGRRNLRNPPELLTRRALEQGQHVRGFVAETLPRLIVALGDEGLANEFRARQGDALRAIEDWLGWLQRDLLPRSRGELALGRDRLAAKLEVEELLDVTPEQLLARGEAELKDARAAFEETARLVLPGKPAGEALHTLEEDHPKPEELVHAAADLLDGATTFARQRDLLRLPEARIKVTELPPYLWGPAATALWGSFEPEPHDAWLYIEPIERWWDAKRREEHLRAFGTTLMRLAILHQAIPGHFILQEELRGAPSALEKLVRSEAFVEGWADYGEQMMIAEGFGGGDARLRLGLLREQLVRLCRLVAVLRVHAFGARLEEAARLFADYAYLDDYSARHEVERAAVDPMSLGAALGRLQILKLREDFRRERGRAFTLLEFHDRLLAHGAVPLVLVRRTLLIEDHGSSL